ncbi:MAG: FAD-dependent oxidoreductase [Saprospiraceae bacterium]|nr:FAD-dependent oxidoreductase [Saprospiraceae bacterium]
MNRTQHLQRLQNEVFDICIIGGGASGAGCALDAALRGLKVALLEKTDFAAETSSRSTKLVHGGVRYLEQAFKRFDFAQLKQVRHGLEERHIVLRNAPHLARPLALLTPVFGWLEGFYFSVGLRLYDWFASGKDALPRSRWLGRMETLGRMSGLTKRIHSAVLYYDGQLDDARYCLALAQSAAHAGAALANHLEVVGFQKDKMGKLASAQVLDRLSGERFWVKAQLFLNCAGPFADSIRQLANPVLGSRIRPSKGVHLVLPRNVLSSDDALLIPKTPDGRVVFAIPFEGQLLLGTTDDDYADLGKEPLLEASEVDFLLETLEPFLAEKVEKTQVKAGFGGLRPLLASPAKSGTKSLVRDHEVEHDPTSNLLSLLGGKWTTYRLMARDAVDRVCELLPHEAPCRTETHLLVGAQGWDANYWQNIHQDYGLDVDVCQHLADKYGTRASKLGDLTKQDPRLGERLLNERPYIKAEVVYAAQEEMACTLRDFLARRIRLETTDWQAAVEAAPTVAYLMGIVLGWTSAQQRAAVDEYVEQIQVFRRRASGE